MKKRNILLGLIFIIGLSTIGFGGNLSHQRTYRTLRFIDNPNAITTEYIGQLGKQALVVRGTRGCFVLYFDPDDPRPTVTKESWGFAIHGGENHGLTKNTDPFGGPAVCKPGFRLDWTWDIPGSGGQPGLWCFAGYPENWCNTGEQTGSTDVDYTSDNLGC